VHHNFHSSNVLHMRDAACQRLLAATDLIVLQRQPQPHAIAGLQLLVRLALSGCSGCCFIVSDKLNARQAPV
jgi:hypothetical protein